MEITIKGSPKEIADLALELQNRLNEIVCGQLITASRCGDKQSLKAVLGMCSQSESDSE